MGMRDKMKQKGIPITSVKINMEVVKRIERADVVALNRSMQPVLEQNMREYNAGLEELEKNSHYFSSNFSSKVKKKEKNR